MLKTENVRLLLRRMESYEQSAWTEEQVSDITALCRDLLAAREDAARLARALTGSCPDGCKGIRLTDGDLLWSGCECLGEDCDCPQHCYPSEQEITEALAAHEAMGGGE